MAGRSVAALLLAAGLALAAAGGLLLCRAVATTAPVAQAYGIRNGGLRLDRQAIDRAVALLDGRGGAEPAAARMFLHYAAAAQAGDRLEWRRQLLAALGDGRAALAAAPTRADVALVLGEIEFILFGPGKWAYAPLRLSLLTAPHELWIIERRIGLDLRLVAAAPADLQSGIAEDVRVLGEPFRDTRNYRILALAAFRAGPAAIATVRRVLAAGHPWPLQFFNGDLDELIAKRKPSGG